MLNPLLLNSYKKRFLFKKIDFLDKRVFFLLGIGLDESARRDARASMKSFSRNQDE